METAFTAEQLAELTRGILEGEGSATVSGVASIEEARSGDIVFAENAKFLAAALKSGASVVITSEEVRGETQTAKTLIVHPEPRRAFVQVLEAFAPATGFPVGIHPTTILGEGVTIGEGVSIAAYVTVGDGAVLGDGVVLRSNVVVGADCAIGDSTVIHPNVTLYDRVAVGKRCILHAGCVIGADGFGYIPVGNALRKVPQLGTVQISDDVEIGANVCIDRAKTGVTLIGQGTKIDNLTQIGHNCRIGMSSILVAQVGLAGGVEIGNGAILAGQVGVKDHVSIGDGARLGGQTGVISDIPAGATYVGFPARPYGEKMREYAASAQLPDALKRLRELEKRLTALEANQNEADA